MEFVSKTYAVPHLKLSYLLVFMTVATVAKSGKMGAFDFLLGNFVETKNKLLYLCYL